jgi:hypothetical protein
MDLTRDPSGLRKLNLTRSTAWLTAGGNLG